MTEREVGEPGDEIRENRDTELNYRRRYATKSNGDDLADIDVIIVVTSLTSDG